MWVCVLHTGGSCDVVSSNVMIQYCVLQLVNSTAQILSGISSWPPVVLKDSSSR